MPALCHERKSPLYSITSLLCALRGGSGNFGEHWDKRTCVCSWPTMAMTRTRPSRNMWRTRKKPQVTSPLCTSIRSMVRSSGSEISQLLTRPHFLHLHSSGGNSGNLAVVHFGKDIDFFSSRMDLVLAILFDSFAKKVFSVKMVFLLREGDARRVDRGSCRDHSEYETPINHELAPFGNGSTPTTSSGFPASIATKSALSFGLNPR